MRTYYRSFKVSRRSLRLIRVNTDMRERRIFYVFMYYTYIFQRESVLCRNTTASEQSLQVYTHDFYFFIPKGIDLTQIVIRPKRSFQWT